MAMGEEVPSVIPGILFQDSEQKWDCRQATAQEFFINLFVKNIGSPLSNSIKETTT